MTLLIERFWDVKNRYVMAQAPNIIPLTMLRIDDNIDLLT